MAVGRFWAGFEIKPFSRVTGFKKVRIDRAAVRVYRTLDGEIMYQVEGKDIAAEHWYPLCEAFDTAADALEACDAWEQTLRQARQGQR